MTAERSATRRGFLAVVGGSALAGCSGLDGLSDDAEPTISTYHLRGVPDDNASDPIVVETIPVAIESTPLHERLQRVNELLDTVPIPLDRARIPNGVIRKRLLRAADDATVQGQRARSARTRFRALQALSQARERARYAAAGWAYVDEDRTTQALRADHRRAVADARTLRATLAYLGEDPVRAALVYAHLERTLDVVLDDPAPYVHESSPLLTVAEWGAHAESARATTDDTHYLHDRYTTSLPDDASDVEDTLVAAANTLATQLQQRHADLPPEPTEPTEHGDEGLGWRLRYRLRDDAESSARRVAEPHGPAHAVVTAVEGFTNFAAYEQISARLDDGGADAYPIKDASDVLETRQRALDAIRTALTESPRADLARPVLADAAATVSYADETLADYSGDVRVPRLYDPVRRYVAAAARAENVSAACRRVLETLRA